MGAYGIGAGCHDRGLRAETGRSHDLARRFSAVAARAISDVEAFARTALDSIAPVWDRDDERTLSC